MKIWAISDLHLGFSTGKWMDRFGEHWKGHAARVAEAWKECVVEGDIVLLPGDFSWAMRPHEVLIDLAWLAKLPGRKVLTKGNHDYWWPGSHKKLNALLPPDVYAIKKRALVLDGVPIVGVRGADFLPREGQTIEGVEAALRKERRELLLSIDSLKQQDPGKCPPFALFHYPPFPIPRSESFFTRIVEDLGCRHCIFGHLHTAAEWERVFQGEKYGVKYDLVSCDALDFAPRVLAEV